MMRGTVMLMFGWILLQADFVEAIEIVEPVEGQRVQSGSTLKIVVKPQAGETWKGVAAAFEALTYDSTVAAYVGTFSVPKRAQLGPREIVISALSSTNQETQLKRTVVVTLPPTTVLTALRVDEDQRILYARVGERDELSVYGGFSDGIERDVSSAFMGTAYTSSDEKVVTVDADGLVTSKGPGTARITIRNGRLELTVETVVKPKP